LTNFTWSSVFLTREEHFMNQDYQFDFSKFQLPNISLRTIRWVIIGVILIIFLVSSVFTVNPEEIGVIQRFGKYTRVASPGLNFKLPFGIETVKKVPVERQLKEEFGDRSVSEVLTIGRVEIANTVTTKLQELCDQYETGIKVDQVVLQDVNPPDSVKPAFNEVNEAQQEREKMINQARAEYNQIIPKARGTAARTIEEAQGHAIERVNQARGAATKL